MGVLPACMNVHRVCSAYAGQKRRVSDPLKMELQMVISHHVDAELGFSARTTNALKHRPSHYLCFCICILMYKSTVWTLSDFPRLIHVYTVI